MTRGEIYLVLGLLAALLLGAIVQWSRGRDPQPTPAVAPTPQSGWAKAPYVFEARRDLDAAAEAAKNPPPVPKKQP